MGKMLIIVGIICLVAGLLITYVRVPFLGKLPGDISVEKENFKFYFPLATSIILSLLASLIIYLIQRFR